MVAFMFLFLPKICQYEVLKFNLSIHLSAITVVEIKRITDVVSCASSGLSF